MTELEGSTVLLAMTCDAIALNLLFATAKCHRQNFAAVSVPVACKTPGVQNDASLALLLLSPHNYEHTCHEVETTKNPIFMAMMDKKNALRWTLQQCSFAGHLVSR